MASKICVLWSGLSIGGVWIAAPAKFAAPSLSLATALEVGRAQFFWLNIAQTLLCAMLLVCLSGMRNVPWRLCAAALLSFIAQLAVYGFLDRLTLEVISGSQSDGRLHAAFVVLEAVKLSCLLVLGFTTLERRR